MTKICYKFTAEKKNIFLSKIAIFQATEEAFSPQKRTSSTSKHEIAKKILFLWVIFALLDPDPESGSTGLIESVDPDPEHCNKHRSVVRIRILLQCCGSGMFIPDPDFYPSQIPDLGSRFKNSNEREG
jgi:hypothetical protein